MPNPYHNHQISYHGQKADKGVGGFKEFKGNPVKPTITFKQGPFNDPGSHQPNDRSFGWPEVKTYAKEFGVGAKGEGKMFWERAKG